MSKQKNKPVMYSALEVANFCGVVNQTAINWIKNNHLMASSTPGGQFRVYPDDLIAFMRERNMRVPEQVLSDAAASKPDAEKNVTASVLVVDDDVALNDVLSQYLRTQLAAVPSAAAHAITVSQAYDGFDAGSKMASMRPSVVVLDLDLPGIDGFDLCRRIKETEDYARPSVVVITALEDSFSESKCRELGVEHYFKKPLAFASVWDAVSTLLKVKA